MTARPRGQGHGLDLACVDISCASNHGPWLMEVKLLGPAWKARVDKLGAISPGLIIEHIGKELRPNSDRTKGKGLAA